MTGNQIAFANYVESKRHNQATEAVSFRDLSERQRHNVVSEGISTQQVGAQYANVQEMMRHNYAQEALTSNAQELTSRELDIKEETNRIKQDQLILEMFKAGGKWPAVLAGLGYSAMHLDDGALMSNYSGVNVDVKQLGIPNDYSGAK